jgi:hypothetical protein
MKRFSIIANKFRDAAINATASVNRYFEERALMKQAKAQANRNKSADDFDDDE